LRLKGLYYKGLPNKYKIGRGFINLGGKHGVGKGETLKEDSSLGLKGINMLYINLGWLVSKRSCTIPYTLFRNGY